MKVLFICTRYPLPASNKRDRRLLNIMKQLAEQGHQLFYSGFSEKRAPEKSLLFQVLQVHPPTAATEDFMLPAEQVFKERIRLDTLKLKPDLVFAYGLAAARYVPFDLNIPAVADFRGCEYIEIQRQNEHGGLFRRLSGAVQWTRIAAAEASLASRFSVVFVPRERDRYYLAKQSTLNLTVLPDAIDTELYDISRRNPGSNRLLFTGSVTEEGNRRAVMHYKENLGTELMKAGAILYVTGKYNEEDKTALFNEHIRPTGFVRDIRPVYAGALAVVIPITGGIGAVGKITEAMAGGVPVISTTDGAEGLGLEDKDKCILYANTPGEMLSAWQRLQDRDFADEIRNNARRFVESRYSWAANSSILSSELERAAGQVKE